MIMLIFKPFKSLFRYAIICLSAFLIPIIAFLNFQLTYKPEFVTQNGHSYNQDVYYQLKYISTQIKEGADDDMQNDYPEGFMFLHCIYSLSWCDLIRGLDASSAIYQEGIKEVDHSIVAINSDRSKQIFTREQALEYGAFYTGWSNYVLAQKLSVTLPENRNQDKVVFYKNQCNRIAETLMRSESPFLTSYQSRAWPSDMMPTIASLMLHDKLFPPVYQGVISQWIDKVKQVLDPTTGLIPHESDFITGKAIEGARGSSQSLLLCFMAEIDADFGKQQFERYSELFIEEKFGLPFLREYPKGQNGKGDIDSGPVIWNIGTAATIVGQRTMATYGNWNHYQALRNSIEAVGMSFTANKEKKYLFGSLPVADAFIAWSNSVELNGMVKPQNGWRIQFHLISLLIATLLCITIYKCR
jgi:hypothetical protein